MDIRGLDVFFHLETKQERSSILSILVKDPLQ